MIEEGDHALVVIEHECPIKHLARGVGHADSLRSRPGAADLAVEPAFLIIARIVDQARLEGDRYEIRLHAANDVGVGEHRLTGGACEYSASGVVRRPVDEDP